MERYSSNVNLRQLLDYENNPQNEGYESNKKYKPRKKKDYQHNQKQSGKNRKTVHQTKTGNQLFFSVLLCITHIQLKIFVLSKTKSNTKILFKTIYFYCVYQKISINVKTVFSCYISCTNKNFIYSYTFFD